MTRFNLDHLTQLLQLERTEELREFQRDQQDLSLHQRAQRGSVWFPIVVDDMRTGPGGQLVLEISRTKNFEQPHSFDANQPVSLFSKSDQEPVSSVQGVVMKVTDRDMRIMLDSDEPEDWFDQGQLGVELLCNDVTHREMLVAVQAVAAAEHGRLHVLREVLYGNRPASFDVLKHAPFLDTLNESQNRALLKVLEAQDVALIHGPPGTGKTTTLIEAIKLTCLNEKQVLVCAPSHVAVDLLTVKLAQAGLKVLRMGHPARVSPDAWAQTLTEKLAQHRNFSLIAQMRMQADKTRQEARRFRRNFGPEERAQRKEMLTKAKKLLREAREFEQRLTQDVLDDAQVIAATLVGVNHRLIAGRHYGTVFIDEAAQALEAACWIPMTKADRVVMAGDHCQLPPTVRSDEAARGGLSQTLFAKVSACQPNAGVMLQTQYRMHPHIMQFSSDYFYKGQLHADQSVLKRVFASTAVEFIDTSGTGFEETLQAETQSYFNTGEVDLVAQHLKQLLDQGYLSSSTPFSVGVIAPYSAQVAALRERLAGGSISEQVLLEVHTVDGFQGQERDVIYISAVRSNLRGEIGFLSDVRRMNVALTRARQKLVLVGDAATLAGHPFYEKLLAYLESIGAYRSAWEL